MNRLMVCFGNYCLHDPTSNADITYRAKIKSSLSYVDDTLTIMPNMAAASSFLDTLNLAHSSVKFTIHSSFV